MTTNMKLIYENYRTGMLFEQDEPETIGDLINGLESYILSNSDKLKRVCQQLMKALQTIADDLPDGNERLTEISEKITEFLESVAENGLKDAVKAIGRAKAMEYLGILAKNPIRKFLANKVGEKVLKFVIEEILPAAKTILSVGKWIINAFKVSKELSKAYKEGTADTEKIFSNIVQDIMTAEDNKETTAGFLGLFNIDDEWQKMLDDKVEIEFIQNSISYIKTLDPSTPTDQLNLNQRLVDFLKAKFEGRTLTKQ